MAEFIYPPVSVDTTGLATEAKQDSIITELQDIDSNTSDNATATNQATIIASLGNIETDIGLLEDRLAGNLVPETFDYVLTTYVAAGNGIGEIETVVYKTGGSGGSTVATLTLAYDANDKLSTVTRT